MAETLVIPWTRVVLDFFLLFCVGFPILCLFLWANPYHRGFFCSDLDLEHPFHDSTVPSIYLYVVGMGLNFTVIFLIEFFNRQNSLQEITFLGFRIPNWLYNYYNIILIFAFGMACSQLTTDIMKYTIGRFRPHFLTVCRPDVCLNQSQAVMNTFWLDFKCTNEKFSHNKRIMKEMRLSFPSGHSSFSMYTMLFFAIYIQKRMTWNGSILLRHTVQLLAILAAIFTGMSRVSDYKHHWSDVLGGFITGTVVALFIASLYKKDQFKTKTDDKKRLYEEIA